MNWVALARNAIGMRGSFRTVGTERDTLGPCRAMRRFYSEQAIDDGQHDAMRQRETRPDKDAVNVATFSPRFWRIPIREGKFPHYSTLKPVGGAGGVRSGALT